MTKAELIAQIAQQTGVNRDMVSVVVESFMENVKKSIVDNRESVFLRGFGTFTTKRRAEKTARNITKNTTLVVPAHDIAYFKPAQTFADEIAASTK